jgi:hypothetical protein
MSRLVNLVLLPVEGFPMAFWRMQLHPTDPDHAAMHTVQSLGAGFIGFGFNKDPGT